MRGGDPRHDPEPAAVRRRPRPRPSRARARRCPPPGCPPDPARSTGLRPSPCRHHGSGSAPGRRLVTAVLGTGERREGTGTQLERCDDGAMVAGPGGGGDVDRGARLADHLGGLHHATGDPDEVDPVVGVVGRRVPAGRGRPLGRPGVAGVAAGSGWPPVGVGEPRLLQGGRRGPAQLGPVCVGGRVEVPRDRDRDRGAPVGDDAGQQRIDLGTRRARSISSTRTACSPPASSSGPYSRWSRWTFARASPNPAPPRPAPARRAGDRGAAAGSGRRRCRARS